jgi:hypothetical protein
MPKRVALLIDQMASLIAARISNGSAEREMAST